MRCGFWLVGSIALSACVPAMTRAPAAIPASGIVECTDTMEAPIAAASIAVLSAGAIAISLRDGEAAMSSGASIWAPTLGLVAVESLFAASKGLSNVGECRAAKRLGAERRELVRREDIRAKARADARAEAGTLWKRAAAAARADDCATTRELAPQIRELDAEFHAVVFSRDVAIARCLVP